MEEIRRGLDLSKELQRCIIEHAGRAIQARRVERYHSFCCLNLSDGLPARARELLARPLALTRLASFVQDVHASTSARKAFHRMGESAPAVRPVVIPLLWGGAGASAAFCLLPAAHVGDRTETLELLPSRAPPVCAVMC